MKNGIKFAKHLHRFALHQWYTGLLISPHFINNYFYLSFCYNHLSECQWVLICNSLMANEVGHLFVRLWVIIVFCGRNTQIILVHFLIVLFIFWLMISIISHNYIWVYNYLNEDFNLNYKVILKQSRRECRKKKLNHFSLKKTHQWL